MVGATGFVGGISTVGRGVRRAAVSMAEKPKVLVAGSQGRLGRRIVDQLVERGIEVKAGSREPTKVRKQEGVEPVRLTLPVETSKAMPLLEDVDVVVCAAASTQIPFGPINVDYRGTVSLIEAAVASRNVKHFVLITSLGVNNQLAWPAAALNLFFGLLFWKSLAENKLFESGLPYTIIRPGGLERLKDDARETRKVELYPARALNVGVVSRFQIAEIVAECVLHPEDSRNKVIEVKTSEGKLDRELVDLIREVPIHAD